MADPVTLEKAVPLALDGWRGELAAELRDAPALDLEHLLDSDRASELLHWSARNLLYRTQLHPNGGASTDNTQVVVKLTRNQGWLRKLQRNFGSSKAFRSWKMARAFMAAGVPTPAPIAWLESLRDDGPSLFITRFEPDLVEVRYFFRALQEGNANKDFPWWTREEVFSACAKALARMHAAGLWHRDASIGNLVLRKGSQGPEVFIVDLNRAHQSKHLSWSKRLRDLCRLPIFGREERLSFLTAYCGASPLAAFAAAHRLYQKLYFGRVEAKKFLRKLSPLKRFRRQHPYEHIPRPTGTTGPRDKATWDTLTDQPFQHSSPAERSASRLRDLPHHLRDYGRALAAAPGIWGRYRALKQQRFRHSIAWPGVGVAIGPGPEDAHSVERLLSEVAASHVLLRVHPWLNPGNEVETARVLAGAGYDLTFALPQIRELVVDLDSWRNAVRRWGAALAPYGNRFQIGQAINRSKWGVWRSDEYVQLLQVAREELPANAVVLGPAVIDFEPNALAVVTTQPELNPPLDIVSSLLYVDRRGAPESRQMGFDAVGKATLMRAIGESTRGGSDRLWVTEVNWPLPAGPHSPAGRAVSVTEEEQADYAVRYFTSLLASGIVERVYWWQLISRGYGLVDRSGDGELRRRPAFSALATLGHQLAGTHFAARLTTGEDDFLLQFANPNGARIVLGWTVSGERTVSLPGTVEAAFSRDGNAVDFEAAGRALLTSSPKYFWLQPE